MYTKSTQKQDGPKEFQVGVNLADTNWIFISYGYTIMCIHAGLGYYNVIMV